MNMIAQLQKKWVRFNGTNVNEFSSGVRTHFYFEEEEEHNTNGSSDPVYVFQY